jgi:hypothetical protein
MGMEAFKHRMDPRSVVMAGEDPAGYEALATDCYLEFAPDGPHERWLVDDLIHDVWIRRRVHRYRAELLRSTHPNAIDAIDEATKHLAMLERSYARALKQLRAIQRKRQPKRSKTSKRGELASISYQSPTPQPRRIPAKTTATGEWIN